jgi:hypothetical protein
VDSLDYLDFCKEIAHDLCIPLSLSMHDSLPKTCDSSQHMSGNKQNEVCHKKQCASSKPIMIGNFWLITLKMNLDASISSDMCMRQQPTRPSIWQPISLSNESKILMYHGNNINTYTWKKG